MTTAKVYIGALLIVLAITGIREAFADSPSIYSQDGKYLGNLNNNKYDQNSVSNPYGRYGSRYSQDSINNPYGQYGSRYSQDSPNNPYGHGVQIYGNDNQ